MIRYPIGSLVARVLRGEPPEVAVEPSSPPTPPSNAGPEFFHGGDFQTESGEIIPDLRICYETWGEMDRFRSNVVLLCHGSTGDRRAMTYLIGPGRPLDPGGYFVIAMDAIGAGLSSSPASTGLRRKFPRCNIRDMVRAQCLALTHNLGLSYLPCVAGLSMGGYMAIEWAVTYPAFIRRAVCLVSAARCSPHSRAIHEGLRTAVMADPAWNSGDYEENPITGLEAAATANFAWRHGDEWYLQYTDEALFQTHLEATRQRYRALDANGFIHMTYACDAHDVSVPFDGDLAAALSRCRMPVLVMPCASDLLIPPVHARLMHQLLPRSTYVEIPSYAGHTASSVEVEFIGHHLGQFLSE